MALSSTERQRNFRARIKAKLAQAGGESDVLVEKFRQDVERVRADYLDSYADEARPDFRTEDVLIGLLSNRNDEDFHGRFLAQALGLPADPWPGLTGDKLVAMTKGRTRDAKRRGVRTVGSGGLELDFRDKLVAARHRAWLLGEEQEEAA